MPWVEHYRLNRPFPRRLVYRNGAIELSVVNIGEGQLPWRFRATKLNQAGDTLDLVSATSAHELDRLMHSDGFEGGNLTSPVRKIMERLVHEGYASTARIKVKL